MNEHDWNDEELLAWLLDQDTRTKTERDALEREPQTRERLEGYEEFLTRCRRELVTTPAQESAELLALQNKILESTTREDLSWGGDLRVVGHFLRHRLHASVLLRVVAASLLIHVAALPVLAYFGWVAPEPQTHVGWEFPAALPYGESEPEPEFDQVGKEASAEQTESALDSLGATATADQLFRDRLRRLGLVDLDGFSGSSDEGSTQLWGDNLGLVLRCELLLDEQARGAGRQAHLNFALGQLRRELETPDTGAKHGALRALAASAWLRGRSLGIGSPDPQFQERCQGWIGELAEGQEYLSGSDWRSVFERADREESVSEELPK